MITIVDYGLGNLGSVANMLKKIGVAASLSGDPGALREARALLLPGVGHFDAGMRNLRDRGLATVLDRLVREEKKPILGICLGMQLLARRSEEGSERGFGWVDADVVKFDPATGPAGSRLAVPHMGWNEVTPQDPTLFAGLPAGEARFYFVHSFYLRCDHPSDVAATTSYGPTFASAVHRDNVWGTQFHPEKSHRFGMRLLENYARAVGALAPLVPARPDVAAP
jgi:imidazole glycerol-phosphate synthase subunit HisH